MSIDVQCDQAPLRVFMGVQMIGWGTLIHTDNSWRLASTFGDGWLWASIMVFGGVWLIIAAAVEAYVRSHWKKFWTQPQRHTYRWLMKYKVVGYFFSGAAWGGVGIHAVQAGSFREVDFLCPLYMVFLLYLAFTDASKKRKGMELQNENNRPTSDVLRSSVAATAGVHTERVRR
jgi:hypothetical protein